MKARAAAAVISLVIGATMGIYVDHVCREQARIAERFLAFVSIGAAFDTVQSMASAAFPSARLEERDGNVELVIPVSYVLGGRLVIASESGRVIDVAMRTHDAEVDLTRARATAEAYGSRGGRRGLYSTDVVFAAISTYVLIAVAGGGLFRGVAWLCGAKPAFPGRVDVAVVAAVALAALVLTSVSRVVPTLQQVWMR